MNGFDARPAGSTPAENPTKVSDLSRSQLNALIARANRERSAYAAMAVVAGFSAVQRAIAGLFGRLRHTTSVDSGAPRRV